MDIFKKENIRMAEICNRIRELTRILNKKSRAKLKHNLKKELERNYEESKNKLH